MIAKAIGFTNGAFILATSERFLKAVSHAQLEIGGTFDIQGQEENGKLYCDKVERTSEEKRIEKFLENASAIKPAIHVVDDAMIKTLDSSFNAAAALLRNAVVRARPIVLRYNDDSDGIGSALVIKHAMDAIIAELKMPLKTKDILEAVQSPSPHYLPKDLDHDIEVVRSNVEKPLVMLLDHGSGRESKEQLEKLHSTGADIVVVDHHPGAQSAHWTIVSPFLHGDKGSEYATGLLAFEIAGRAAGTADRSSAMLAMKGDKSPFAGEEGKENAALDLLGAQAEEYRDPLAYIEERMPRLQEFAKKAEELLTRARNLALANGKLYEGNISVFASDLSKACRKGEYPPKGKVINLVHEAKSAELKKALVTVGYSDEGASIRANAQALEKGFGATKLFATLREEFSHHDFNGGGHEMAASFRVRREAVPRVVQAIVRETTPSA